MDAALADFRTRCPGVLGSWLFDGQGVIRAHDTSPMFAVDAKRITADLLDVFLAVREFSDVGRRNGFDPAVAFQHDLSFHYDTASLLVRPAGSLALAVVTEPDTNTEKVRSMSRLLMLRIARQAEQRQLTTGT
jgi:hypothetical protein